MSMTEALARVSKQYCDRTEATFEMTIAVTDSVNGLDATLDGPEGARVEVDWGDTNVEQTTLPATHTFASGGTYSATVDIVGVGEIWSDDLVVA